MTTFQLVTLPLLGAMFVLTVVAAARKRVSSGVSVFWLLIWMGAGISIAFPDIPGLIAKFLGIGRGADLVFYLAILFMFGAFFLVYLRFRRLDEQITRLVRHLAIRDAKEPGEKS